MGNALLDFVMALVRDREAAARFAADPSNALSAAGLAGVTVADVNNLLPMVSDSMATTTPAFGMGTQGGIPDGNVWASGAATAAFDAFDTHRSAVVPPLNSVDPIIHPAVQPPAEASRAEPALASLPDRPDLAGPQFDPTWIDAPGHDVTGHEVPGPGALGHEFAQTERSPFDPF